MKYFLLSFFLFITVGHATAQTGWTLLPTPAGTTGYSIPYFSNDTGYIFASEGAFKLFQTTDAGNSWEKISVPFTDYSSFRFLNKDNFYFIQSFSDSTIIFKTQTGGKTWGKSMLGVHSRSLFFFNDNVGFACGADSALDHYGKQSRQGVIEKSLDSGKTWSRIYADTTFRSGYFSDISFTDSLHGYAYLNYVNMCNGISELWCTTDGGTHWHNAYYDKITIETSNCHHIPNSDIWIRSWYQKMDRSSDGGQTWVSSTLIDRYKDISSDYILSFSFGSDSVIYATSYFGKVFKTIDQGIHWFELSVPAWCIPPRDSSRLVFHSITATSPKVVYLSGKNFILKTIDGGGIPMGVSTSGNTSSLETSTLAEDYFTVTLSGNNTDKIAVYDALGKAVESTEVRAGTEKYTLDIRKYTPGVYFVKIESRFSRFVKP